MHTKEFHLTEKDITRFWSHVDVRGADDCWIWQAYRDKNGYGQMGVGRAVVLSHRIAWTIKNGTIPQSHDIHHRPTCSTACCNYGHLTAMPHAEHAALTQQLGQVDYANRPRATGDKNGSRLHPERLARGESNGAHTHPEKRVRVYGEENGSATLTSAKAIEIPVLRKQGFKMGEIGKRIGATPAQVWNVLHGRSWSKQTGIPSDENKTTKG